MNCRTAGEWLSPYLEGELDARRAGLLEAHLAGCPHCAAELQTLREAVRLLAAPKTTAQPENLLAEFKQRLAAERPPLRRPWWNAPWAWSLAGLGAAAAAAGISINAYGPILPQPRTAEVMTDIARAPEATAPPPGPAATAPMRAPAGAEPAGPATMAHPAGDGKGTLQFSPPPRGMSPQLAPGARPGTIARAPAQPPSVAGPPARPELRAPGAVPPHSMARVVPRGEVASRPVPLAQRDPLNRGRQETRIAAAPPAPVLRRPENALGRGAAGAGTANRVVPEEMGRRREDVPAATAVPPAAAPVEPPARVALAPAVPPAPPEQAPKLDVVVHRPFPEGADATLKGGVAGGFGATAAPPGAAGPTTLQVPGGASRAPSPAAQITAAAAVAPEVAAAMRASVNVKVSNVPLAGLADRLAANAEVPIVVEGPAGQEVRVSAELNRVPLYRALEKVASEANLVIEPRPGGVALQPAGPSQAVESLRAGPPGTGNVWSPGWGELPRRGFAIAAAPVRAATLRMQPAAESARNSGLSEKETREGLSAAGARKRAPAAAPGAASPQNFRLQAPAAGQQLPRSFAPTLACPHCRRPLPAKQQFHCSKCKRAVEPFAVKCRHCSQPNPAHCPHCRRPLAAPPKGKG